MVDVEWVNYYCQAFQNAINQGNVEEAYQMAQILIDNEVKIQVALNLSLPPPIPVIPSTPNYNQKPAHNQAPKGPIYTNQNSQQRSISSIDKTTLKELLVNMGYSPIMAQQAAKRFETIDDCVNYLSKKH
ncbi:unnamed protein product [Blepharisma stoltei]|uniref:UBA domain-containing protein n=1 Tax=Blepharisma stoltei TaxID=1481888 RepID=A0AAU9KEK2_9CILI|nr:unnamed protein product [Blepharisma stoltei]